MNSPNPEDEARLMERAKKAVRRCETEIQGLVAEAARSGSYEEIERLTTWAKTLRGMAAAATDDGPIGRSQSYARTSGVGASVEAEVSDDVTRPKRSRGRGYPKFVRSGDDLVKVGWSKKKRQEYIHRAPRSRVEALAYSLGGLGTTGAPIPTDEILSTHDGAGDEIPAYQIYLALAWMREQGVVERHGRTGYTVMDPALLSERFDELWTRANPEGAS